MSDKSTIEWTEGRDAAAGGAGMTRTVAADLAAVESATTWPELRAAARALWDWPVHSPERDRLCNRVSEKKQAWSSRHDRAATHRLDVADAIRHGRTKLPSGPPRSVPPPKIGRARPSVAPPPPPPAIRLTVDGVDAVKRAVANYFGVSVARIEGDQRDALVVRARQVAMFLMHEELLLSTVQIGHALHRDHTTVLHGLGKVRTGMLRESPTGTAVRLLRTWWQEEAGRVAQAV
jgi:Bacterial dnaA protein helix-turn-helix